MDDKNDRQMESLFAAGRAAAARGWLDAVLVTGPEVLEIAPIGPPVVLVVDGAEFSVREAKALASASGAGRRILVLVKGPPIDPQALAWMGHSVEIELLADPTQQEAQRVEDTGVDPEDGPGDRIMDTSSPGASEAPDKRTSSPAGAADDGKAAVADEQYAEKVADAAVPVASEGTLPSETERPTEPRRRKALVLSLAAVAFLALVAFGSWWMVIAQDSSPTSVTDSPSASPSEGGRTALFDTDDAQRQTIRSLAKDFDVSNERVTVSCPDRVLVSEESFSCPLEVDVPGDDVTGAVNFTLVKQEGDSLRLRVDYSFD